MTGAPVFNYLTADSVGTEADLFTTIQTHLSKGYLVTATSLLDGDLGFQHTFSVLACFTLTDTSEVEHQIYLVRDPILKAP